MRIIIVLATALALSTLAGCATTGSSVTRQGDTAVRAESRRISEAARMTGSELPIAEKSALPVTTF